MRTTLRFLILSRILCKTNSLWSQTGKAVGRDCEHSETPMLLVTCEAPLWAGALSPGPITQVLCSVWGRLLGNAAAASAGEAHVLASEVPAKSARWEQKPSVVPSQSSASFLLRSRKEEGETMSPLRFCVGRRKMCGLCMCTPWCPGVSA